VARGNAAVADAVVAGVAVTDAGVVSPGFAAVVAPADGCPASVAVAPADGCPASVAVAPADGRPALAGDVPAPADAFRARLRAEGVAGRWEPAAESVPFVALRPAESAASAGAGEGRLSLRR
jgi:hypothetical protein